MEAERTADGVTLRFQYDEAIVLSSLLSRWVDEPTAGANLLDHREWIVDQSERRVLCDLCASFEPMIDEVLSDNSDEVLDIARAAVMDQT